MRRDVNQLKGENCLKGEPPRLRGSRGGGQSQTVLAQEMVEKGQKSRQGPERAGFAVSEV